MFEGIYQKHSWTQHELDEIYMEITAILLDKYTVYARQLDMTHQLRTPLHEIKEVITGQNDDDDPVYRLYSAHDDNIANLLT